MKRILVIGAGRTATALINYLVDRAQKQDWFITVADQSLELALEKAGSHSHTKAIKFNIFDDDQREAQVAKADIVASLLPETLHLHLIKDCIKHRVHLVTASYVSQQMSAIDEQVKDAGLIFLNEMGLDPGIDHMDTLKLISKVKNKGGKLTSLRSFGGGLVAPESDDNPWGYKITWNPMNVVTAGMASARYVENGKMKIVPYNRLFLDTRIINVPGAGKFEAYPNRDSIKYRRIYNIPKIPNVFRGSLRRIGFCEAWHAIVNIGLTDNRYFVPDSDKLTYDEWISFYLKKRNGETTKKSLLRFLEESSKSDIIKKLDWLGLFSDEMIGIKDATPADILLNLLLKKWEYKKTDKDMVLLHTEVEYQVDNKNERTTSTFVIKGEDDFRTAMSRTVGLPMGIGVNLILNNKIKERGVIIPVHSDIYKPVLKELEEMGIRSVEKTEVIS